MKTIFAPSNITINMLNQISTMIQVASPMILKTGARVHVADEEGDKILSKMLVCVKYPCG